jgi:cation diffusion facilitator family transporter
MLVTSIIGFGCVYLNLVVLFFCCNDPKKKPEDEVDEEKFIVDELVDRLKLGRGALLKKTNVSPGTPRSSHSGRSGTNNVELLPAGNERGSIRDKDQEQKLSPVNTIFTESPKPREEIHQEFRGYVREGEDEEKKEGENVNIRAAIIHMAGDLVQSLGVIAAAIIIYVGDKNGHPEWKIADPICTFLFSVLVLMTTVPIFGDMMRILLEGTPAESVDTIELFDAITKVSKRANFVLN